MLRQRALAFGILAACAGCDDGPNPSVTDGAVSVDDEAPPLIDDPTVCSAAGGQCVTVDVFGNPECALLGPDNACYPDQNGGGSFCCAYDAGFCPYGTIKASDYNQSCKVDSDCIAIAEGDSCTLCGLRCLNAAINIMGSDYYLEAIANTAAYVSSQRPACNLDCPPESEDFGSCCIADTCQFGSQCGIPGTPRDATAAASVSDAADAAGD